MNMFLFVRIRRKKLHKRSRLPNFLFVIDDNVLFMFHWHSDFCCCCCCCCFAVTPMWPVSHLRAYWYTRTHILTLPFNHSASVFFRSFLYSMFLSFILLRMLKLQLSRRSSHNWTILILWMYSLYGKCGCRVTFAGNAWHIEFGQTNGNGNETRARLANTYEYTTCGYCPMALGHNANHTS